MQTFSSPELVAEDSVTIWSKSQGILPSRESIKRKLKKLYFYISDLVTDPRIGPSFLLGACLSFATIWLQKNRTIQSATPVSHQKVLSIQTFSMHLFYLLLVLWK